MLLTILTPTFNRVHTLPRLYESLEKQSYKEFNWLIIDDGSTDGTKDYVNSISEKSSIKINYISKKNGGKHTAINEGVKHIESPLTFIVDSDDYLTQDAVETIYSKWEVYRNNPNIGSMWFLQSDNNGDIVGGKFPGNDDLVSDYTDVIINSNIKGDKRAVYLTKVRKEFPFPKYQGEKFIGESTVHKRIASNYKGVFVNKVIYKGEYLEEGLSTAGRDMRIKNPLGGMANSKEFLTKDVVLTIRIKKMILYIVYGLFAKLKINKIVLGSGNFCLAILCTPFAYSLYRKWSKYNNK